MIVPDVNLLIHAYNVQAVEHAAARSWWETALNQTCQIGFAWVSLLGFLRIATDRSIGATPMRADEAVGCVRSWLQNPRVTVLSPGDDHAEILFGLLGRLGVAGNLTTDAHLAALAIEYQAEIATTDADFSRFPGLRWFNPLALKK